MLPETPEITLRLERIAELLSDAPLADGALDETRRHIVHVIREYLVPRLVGSATTLVVAVAGAGGVGKSHLVNAITGAHHTAEGSVRPTTTAPVVVVSQRPGDGWPHFERRLRAAAPVVAIRRDGGDVASLFAVIDLPALAGADMRLLDLADLVMVVVTPGRYADRSTWALIRRLEAGGWPTWIVLNRTSGPDDEVIADLRRRLRGEGIKAPVLCSDDPGTAELRSRLLEAGGPGRAGLLQEAVGQRAAHVMRAAAAMCGPLDELDRHTNELRAIVDAEYARAAEAARALVDRDTLGPGAADEPWSVLADRLAGVLTHRVGAAAGRTAAAWALTEAGCTLLADGGESLWRHTAEASTETHDRLLGWEATVTEIVAPRIRRRSSQSNVAEVTAAVMRAALGGSGKVRWRTRRRLRGSVDEVAVEAAAQLAAIASDIVSDDRHRFLGRLAAGPATGLVEELRRISDAFPAGSARPIASAEAADA
jgi:hypothetical protein